MDDTTVSVTFVDALTGDPIARSNVPVAQLPETFALDTELDMGGTRYVVVRARPQTKAEFSETRSLVVALREAARVDPKTLLFSLATISGAALPRTADVHVLQEDDFRQYEFVAEGLHREISEEFASIRRIHVTAAAGVGWREIHVRDRIPNPLTNAIRWRQIAALLETFERLGAVALGDATKPILGAVAVRLEQNVILWGVEEGGVLTTLCIDNLGTATESTIATLKRVADALSLVLVDWCRCRAYASGDSELTGVLGEPWDGAD